MRLPWAQQDEALKHISGFYLQGKDLRGAILYEAVLSRVDLRAKRVSRLIDFLVNFLVCTRPVPADQNEIRCRSLLDGADLRWAYLQYAWLNEASLNHAKLDNSRLRGADLSGAQLQHAEISYHPHSGWYEEALPGRAISGEGPIGAI
jgi:uncharacterized protein YjbI with pentapeptide repeats